MSIHSNFMNLNSFGSSKPLFKLSMQNEIFLFSFLLKNKYIHVHCQCPIFLSLILIYCKYIFLHMQFCVVAPIYLNHKLYSCLQEINE